MKKIIFFVPVNFKRIIGVGLCLCLLVITACTAISNVSANQVYLGTIIVDPGHGGKDGGCTGHNGSIEKDLTLKYAYTLKAIFEEFGYNVILTRRDENGLYKEFANNKKMSDLTARLDIVNSSNALFLISLHMNSFSSTSCKGAQVFYKQNSSSSKNLASCIQNQFKKNLPFAKKSSLAGDYYLLNNSNIPSILIECGFISNPEEEKLILTKEHRQKLCYNILCGVISFYNN